MKSRDGLRPAKGEWGFSSVSLAILLLLALFFGIPQKADAQAGVTNFDSVTLSGDLLVGGDGTYGGNLAVTGAIVAADYFTGDGDIIIPGNWTFEEDVTVTGLLTVTGATRLESTTNMIGNVADSGGVWTVADNALIDGQADVVQLTVQGNATQSSNPNLFVVENSAGVDQLIVTNAGNATLTADLTVGDDLVVTDDATVNDLTVADFVNVTAQTAISLTMNGLITPTGSLQPLESAGAVSIDGGESIAHVADYLILVNIGGSTITITETTGLISAGNIALGAGDASTLVWADDGWIEIARSNN